MLQRKDLLRFVYELVTIQIEEDIRKNVVPMFIVNFKEKCETLEGFKRFQESVKHLYLSVANTLPLLQKLEQLKYVDSKLHTSAFGAKNAIESYKITLIGTILFDLPSGYTSIIQNFYCVAFKAFCNCNYPAHGKSLGSMISIFTETVNSWFGFVSGGIIVKCSEHRDQSVCNCKKALGAFDCVNKYVNSKQTFIIIFRIL